MSYLTKQQIEEMFKPALQQSEAAVINARLQLGKAEASHAVLIEQYEKDLQNAKEE